MSIHWRFEASDHQMPKLAVSRICCAAFFHRLMFAKHPAQLTATDSKSLIEDLKKSALYSDRTWAKKAQLSDDVAEFVEIFGDST